MSEHNGKYITFKRADYDAIIIKDGPKMSAELKHVLLQSEVNDAVVIRRQDVFAGPALHTYAHSIALAASQFADGEQRKKLQDIADYFHEQAVLADEMRGKLPD